MTFSPIRPIVLALCAAALAIVAYANSLHGPFTFDDAHEIVENRSIEDLSRPRLILRGTTRPLVNLSYALDYARGERDVFAYHVTNVVLHVLNVLLLYLLIRRLAATSADSLPPDLTGVDATAFLAASLFAVHPMMTETVSYISSRSDLLAGAFVLASLYCFRRGFDGGASWLAIGLTTFLFGLASKETAAMLPFILFASDLLVPSRTGWRSRFWRIHAPLITFVLVAGAYRFWRYTTVEQPGVGAPFTWGHVAMQAHVVVRYLTLLVAPVSQTIVPNVTPMSSIRDSRLVMAVVCLAGLAALALWARRRSPLVPFGLAWFALALVPSSVLSLPEKIVQPMAEHRAYLASVGFFMGTAALVLHLTYAYARPRRQRVLWLAVGFAAVLAPLAVLTIARNRMWADPVTLWADAARKAPDVYAAQAGLGYEQWLAGDCDAAAVSYRRAMDLRPGESDPYVISADCFLRRGRLDDAEAMLRLGTIRAPQAAKLRLALASLEEIRFRRPAEALRLCREALAIEPRSAAAQECIGRNLAR